MWAQFQETVRSGLLNRHRSGLGGLGRAPTPARSKSSLQWDRVREALQRGRSQWSPATQQIGSQERPRDPTAVQGCWRQTSGHQKRDPYTRPSPGGHEKLCPASEATTRVPHAEDAAPLTENSTPKSGLLPTAWAKRLCSTKGEQQWGRQQCPGATGLLSDYKSWSGRPSHAGCAPQDAVQHTALPGSGPDWETAPLQCSSVLPASPDGPRNPTTVKTAQHASLTLPPPLTRCTCASLRVRLGAALSPRGHRLLFTEPGGGSEATANRHPGAARQHPPSWKPRPKRVCVEEPGCPAPQPCPRTRPAKRSRVSLELGWGEERTQHSDQLNGPNWNPPGGRPPRAPHGPLAGNCRSCRRCSPFALAPNC